MTIIEPNKNRLAKKINLLFITSLLVLLFVAVWSIFVYNQTVNLGYKLNISEREYKAQFTRNAELKNDLYKIIDAKNLHNVAKSSGLVKVVSPEYLEASPKPLLASIHVD